MTMLSTLGMYNYDDTLFDNLALPSGVDKEMVIDSILFETAELELLYTDFDYLKNLIGLWSQREKMTWDKLLELFNEEYNPLYNVDAHETLTENRDLNGSNSNVESRNLNGTNTNTETRNLASTEDATNTRQVSGFNDESFKNSEKSIDDIDRTDTGTITNIGSSTDGGTITNESINTDKGTITTTNRRYGNIGVTMSQQMVEAEMRVRPQMNIVNYITESFKKRFCLMVY